MKNVTYQLLLSVTPENNPDLELPSTLATRRGVCVKGDVKFAYAITDGHGWNRDLTVEESQMVFELLMGMRAIDHALQKFLDGQSESV